MGRPDLVTGNYRSWKMTTCEEPRKTEGDQNRKNGARKDDSWEEGNWLKMGTPRMVLFLRGGECNIPLAYP